MRSTSVENTINEKVELGQEVNDDRLIDPSREQFHSKAQNNSEAFLCSRTIQIEDNCDFN